jgi:NADPH:quinone reductase-like Zn-dependent oxidoreductase
MKGTMRAIVQDVYGLPDVLALGEFDQPVVNDDDVLVRVHASSVNALEWHLLTGVPYLVRPQAGLWTPKGSAQRGSWLEANK